MSKQLNEKLKSAKERYRAKLLKILDDDGHKLQKGKIESNFNNYSTNVMLIVGRYLDEITPGYQKCDDCGNSKSDVSRVECPYQRDVNDKSVFCRVCNDCYGRRCEDI